MSPRRAGRGFTLLELLVAVSIIALLLSIVLTSLGRVRGAARGVMCANNLKTVTYQFFLFADDYSRARRADAATPLGRLFRVEDFQEKIYGLDEYWDAGTQSQAVLKKGNNPLMCPAGAPASLTKIRHRSCSQSGVGPTRDVSMAFNMRLDQIGVTSGAWTILKRTRLTSEILSRNQVPLAFDADGTAADEKQTLPYFAAPPAGDIGPYGTGRFWFPSTRHGQKMNVAFIGGHVLNVAEAGQSPQANWRYQPPLR